jgi:hypothetical protein
MQNDLARHLLHPGLRFPGVRWHKVPPDLVVEAPATAHRLSTSWRCGAGTRSAGRWSSAPVPHTVTLPYRRRVILGCASPGRVEDATDDPSAKDRACLVLVAGHLRVPGRRPGWLPDHPLGALGRPAGRRSSPAAAGRPAERRGRRPELGDPHRPGRHLAGAATARRTAALAPLAAGRGCQRDWHRPDPGRRQRGSRAAPGPAHRQPVRARGGPAGLPGGSPTPGRRCTGRA